MMYNARLIPDMTHKLRLPPGASVALLAQNGLDVLCFVLHRQTDAGDMIVVNDCISDRWGVEERFVRPPDDAADAFDLAFKFSGGALEVWNASYALRFDRFDRERCDQVRFARFNNGAENPDNSLLFVLDGLDRALASIEAHLLHRRMDALEKQLEETGMSLDEGLATTR